MSENSTLLLVFFILAVVVIEWAANKLEDPAFLLFYTVLLIVFQAFVGFLTITDGFALLGALIWTVALIELVATLAWYRGEKDE